MQLEAKPKTGHFIPNSKQNLVLYQPAEPRLFNSNCHPVLGAIKASPLLCRLVAHLLS
jgi:hypothetical protein